MTVRELWETIIGKRTPKPPEGDRPGWLEVHLREPVMGALFQHWARLDRIDDRGVAHYMLEVNDGVHYKSIGAPELPENSTLHVLFEFED